MSLRARVRVVLVLLAVAAACAGVAGGSLPPLAGGKAPRNLDELWGDYDPAAEPIEARTVREWRDGSIVCRYVTYAIGTFKGRKSTMAAFYAFPAERSEGPWTSAEYSSFHGEGVNLDNRSDPFGFHSSANVVMCDGSTHAWSAEMDADVMRALMSKDGGEIIRDTDWR